MTEFLSSSFVIIILVLTVFGAGAFALLSLLAGQGHPGARWLVCALVATGLLVYILGGF
jgi:hypothetical protein